MEGGNEEQISHFVNVSTGALINASCLLVEAFALCKSAVSRLSWYHMALRSPHSILHSTNNQCTCKLHRCADYVKHLVELTKAKEAAIEQAKSDLEEKKQERLERKKKAAEEGEGGDNHGELKPKADNIPPASDANAIMKDSDPESETSSLTAFSSGEGADDGKEEGVRCSKKIRAASSSSDDVDRDGEKKTASSLVSASTALRPIHRLHRRKFVFPQVATRAVVLQTIHFLPMNLGRVARISLSTK